MTDDQFFEAALTLENDGQFYKTYTALAKHQTAAGARRDVIEVHLKRLLPHLSNNGEDREVLRRYFDNRYKDEIMPICAAASSYRQYNANLPNPWDLPAGPNSVAGRRRNPSPEVEGSTKAAPATQPQPKKETAMNTTTKAIEITTKTLVNGVDVANLAPADIYDLIAAEEARIATLGKIEAKPKMLQDEIERRKAGVAALVAHLDSTYKAA